MKKTFKITGMHCTSCAMLIDGDLEDTHGVQSATTNYAKAETEIDFNEAIISDEQLVQVIKNLGYQAEYI